MFSYMYIFSHNKKYALYLISLLGRGYIYIYILWEKYHVHIKHVYITSGACAQTYKMLVGKKNWWNK